MQSIRLATGKSIGQANTKPVVLVSRATFNALWRELEPAARFGRSDLVGRGLTNLWNSRAGAWWVCEGPLQERWRTYVEGVIGEGGP